MKNILPFDLVQLQDYLQFIPNNTRIPEKLKNVNQEKYQKFIEAYQSSDFDNAIFDDADFHIYVFNGVGKDLQYEDVMNLLILMNALMTYTERLNLKPEDKVGKQSSQKKLFFLKKETELELKLINAIIENYHFTAEKKNVLIEKIKNLAEFQRYFIKIPTNPENVYSASLYNHVPIFLSGFMMNYESDSFYIPSFSLIQCILDTMELRIKIFPVLGTIMPKTLLRFRQQCMSPLQTYCPDVKNNLTEDTGAKQFIFDLLCHDLFHLFKLFYIGEKHYHFIFGWFIPKLQNLQDSCQNDSLGKSIDHGIDCLVDANFKEDYFAGIEGNFSEMMKACFYEMLGHLSTEEDSKLIVESIFNLLFSHHDYLKEHYGIDSFALAKSLCVSAKKYCQAVSDDLHQKLISQEKTSKTENPYVTFPLMKNADSQGFADMGCVTCRIF